MKYSAKITLFNSNFDQNNNLSAKAESGEYVCGIVNEKTAFVAHIN